MEQKMRMSEDGDWIDAEDFYLVCKDWVDRHLRLPDGYEGALWIVLSKTPISESWVIRVIGDREGDGDREVMVGDESEPTATYDRYWNMVYDFNGKDPVYMAFDFEE